MVEVVDKKFEKFFVYNLNHSTKKRFWLLRKICYNVVKNRQKRRDLDRDGKISMGRDALTITNVRLFVNERVIGGSRFCEDGVFVVEEEKNDARKTA